MKNFVLAGMVTASACALAVPEKQQPNLILILADDLGYGHVSANMQDYSLEELNPAFFERDQKINEEIYDPQLALDFARLSTKNIGRLAEQGIRMTDAHVAMSLCAPSRCALMTARYPQRFGGYCNSDVARDIGLPNGETTLVPALKEAGYATAMIGKWHLQSMAKPVQEDKKWQHPLKQGFDYYYGFNNSTSRYIEPSHWFNGYKKIGKAQIPYSTDVLTREALGFIERSKEQPFFLYLAYNAPHGPYHERPPEKYMSEFNSGNKRLDHYNGIVKAMDDGIGQIMDRLAELEIDEETLIVFMSDNGPGGSRFAVLPGAGAFRGMKGHIWQGGLRVPMIMRWPGKIKPGTQYNDLISSMDVMPSFLAAAGATPPAGVELDGKNVLSALTENAQEPIHQQLFFAGQHSEFWGLEGQLSYGKRIPDTRGSDPAGWAVREGHYILRYWGDSDSFELYNVVKDPGEKINVISPEHAVRVAAMKKAYADWFADKKQANVYDPDRWKQLVPKTD